MTTRRELERAVISAARSLVRDARDVITGDQVVTDLVRAVDALDAYERSEEHA